jgi:hypothetical protein
MMVSHAHMLFFNVDRSVFVSHSMGLGELVEARDKTGCYVLMLRLRLMEHTKRNDLEQPGRDSSFLLDLRSRASTCSEMHLTAETNRLIIR